MSVLRSCLVRCRLAALLLLGPGVAVAAAGPPDEPPSAAEIEHALGGIGDTPPAPEVALGHTVAAQSIVIPFVAEGGHILIEASLDGHPPRPFFLDSGARTTVTPEAAQDLDSAFGGDRLMSGFGPHLLDAKVVTARKITLGAAVIEDQKVLVAELRNGLVDRGSKPRSAGLIGAELLRKYTVRIDYRNRRLTLIPPGRFEPPDQGFSLPLTTQITLDGLFQASVAVQIDHVVGRFLIDTGMGSQIHLTPAFEHAHQFFDRYAKVITITTAGGIGGHERERMGFGTEIAIGPSAFPLPLVSTPVDAPSRMRQGMREAGLIGNGLLARFVVTLDYKNGRIYFEPDAAARPRTSWEGTGLVFDKPEHAFFEIIDVLPGTAAERAGLRSGEHIVAINGHPARDLGLGDIGTVTLGKEMTVETADGQRFDLAVGPILP